MAKPKRKRIKKQRPFAIPDQKPVNRPQSLPEDLVARPPTGKHRAHSEAGYGTGGGEWGFIHANRARPRPVGPILDHEEAMAKVRLLIAVEDWIKNCAEDVIHVVGQRQVRVFRASA